MLTAEEMVRALMAQGVPREMAEKQARAELVRNPYTGVTGGDYTVTFPRVSEKPPQISDTPITLRIPWSALVSDNALYVVREGKRYRTAEYKAAQKAIAALARDAMQDRPLYDAPLSITFRFWVPNGQRRDVQNFIAGLADSLKGVVWTDDHWLHEGGWRLVGRDIDAPRCELTITPLSPTEP